MAAFENALRHNPNSVLGLNAVASIARSRDNFDKAIEYFQRILNINQDNGEVWGSMGHCLLMKDDLPKAYTAYQQALYHLPNPKVSIGYNTADGRSRSSGMASGYYTIDMARSNMRKRRSLVSLRWMPVSADLLARAWPDDRF